MERLPGVDAGFLYMETPSMHMHTLKLSVIEPPEDGYDFAMLRDELDKRLHLLPPFCRRIVPVPFGLNHPVWYEDADVDIDAHLYRVVLHAPARWSDVERVVGEIASRPLDPDRPLWEIHAIEGLESGRIAILAKIHHALADGVASAALLANVMDSTPTTVPSVPREEWHREPLPQPTELRRDAVRDLWEDLRRLPELLRRTYEAVRALIRYRRAARVTPPRPVVDAPRTSFNRALTAERIFATTSLPLDDVKTVRRAFGVNFTDVVLAVVGGALRSWLLDRAELPAKPLVVGVPVAVDDALASSRLVGNRVSNLFTTLATDVADPVARLRRIAEVSEEARKFQEILGRDMLVRWTQFTPPKPFAAFMRAYSRLRLANLHPPPINLVVSNVPGPREELTIAGARLVDLYSVGPVLEGIGLNITVWSYLDRMNFAGISSPESLPDLRGIVDRLGPALDELVALARQEAERVPA